MGPKIFSRGARPKRQPKKQRRANRRRTRRRGKKSSGEKCTNHTPLLGGEGRAASWSSPAAQDTRSHAVAGRTEAEGETHRKFHSRRWRRASVFHRFRVGLSRDFIWIFAVLKDSFPPPHTHTLAEIFRKFFLFFLFAVLRPWHFPSLILVPRRARRFVYAFVNVVTEIFTSGALGVITIMKSYYEPWG